MSECGLCSQGLPMSGGSYSRSAGARKATPKTNKTTSKRRQKGGDGDNVMILESGTSVDGIQWRKIGAPGNACLDIFLKHDQCIAADKHAMLFMDGDMKMSTELKKGAIGRFFSGESMFMSKYTGTNASKAQRISLGTGMPGDIVAIQLSKDDSWKVSRGCYLAGSHDLLVTGKANLVGIVGVGQDEGAILSYVKAKNGPGTIWLAAYGHIEKHVLKEGETMLVDNEHFLACNGHVSYQLSKVGNMKSLVFGGEGFAMKFTGPCALYTQSKGVREFVKHIMPYIQSQNGSKKSALTGMAIGMLASNSG